MIKKDELLRKNIKSDQFVTTTFNISDHSSILR